MEILNKKISSDLLFRVLFNLIFWFFLMVLPILNAYFDEDKERLEILIKILPLVFFSIPFFYFNSDFLINKFLKKGNISGYILSLLLLFVIFLISYYFIKDYLVDKYPIRIYDSRTLFPVLFIISMSTLYGFIIFMTRQARTNQEEKEERLKSELSFLRSQISPHFIFNVLNSIVYLIRSKSKNAERVTLELSELIRYMLYDSDNKQVMLDNEIKYLANYVELQKIRFGEDVEIILNMEGDFNNKTIEPMLLIPFVENAFKHGVGYVLKPFIEIDINCSGNKFTFKVKNKVGPETSEEKEPNSGIGLKNVKRRIELLYPNTHKLVINQNNGYFDSELSIELKNSL